LSKLADYANGEPLGATYVLSEHQDAAVETAPGRPVTLLLEDAAVGVFAHTLTACQAEQLGRSLVYAATASHQTPNR
jgi:hypothetical protein